MLPVSAVTTPRLPVTGSVAPVRVVEPEIQLPSDTLQLFGSPALPAERPVVQETTPPVVAPRPVAAPALLTSFAPGERLSAAVGEVLQQHRQPSPERDQLLLQGFLREGRSSEELSPYLGLLQDPGAQFHVDAAPMFDYQNLEGYDAARIGEALDRLQPLYGELRELATTLPPGQQTMYRYGKAGWKEDTLATFADGHMDIGELYHMRGFGSTDRIDGCDQAAVYAADNPESGKRFGDTRQTFSLAPSAVYLDNTDPLVLERFEGLCQKYGVYDVYGHTAAREDLYYKAGIDVVRDVEDNLVQSRPDMRDKMRGYYSEQGFFKIYNPEVITGVR